jgi:CBS domain-containing protein
MKPSDTIRSVLKYKSPTLYSLPPDASVYDAIELMSQKGIGAILVMTPGRLVGFLSERDYARKVILKGKSSRDTQIREIMSVPVITVTPGDTVDECMRIMTGNRIRHLPVMDDGGRVIGIVSIGDLVKWIISAQEEMIHHLHNYISGGYPG